MNIADREKRVGLRLPVSVSGRDVGGAPFAEATRSLNISGGGLCFESRQNLGVGSRVSVRIELPPPLRKHFGSKATYRALAVVCRVERNEGETVCRVGARFLEEVEA
jgi:hypothetical protein